MEPYAYHEPCIKTPFANKELAEEALAAIRRRTRDQNGSFDQRKGGHRFRDRRTLPCRAYHCPRCMFWHLTSREEGF